MLVREMKDGDVGYISENAIVVSLPGVKYSITGMYTVVKDNSGFRKTKIVKTMGIFWVDYELLDPTSIVIVNEIDNINRYPIVLLPVNALEAIVTKYVTRRHKVVLHDNTSIAIQANHFDTHNGILYFWNDGVEKYSRVNIATFAPEEWRYTVEE